MLGLAILIASQIVSLFLDLFSDDRGRFFWVFLFGAFIGASTIAMCAPKYKFRLGALLAIPAVILIKILYIGAEGVGISAVSPNPGSTCVLLAMGINFTFILPICATGAAVGCIISKIEKEQ